MSTRKPRLCLEMLDPRIMPVVRAALHGPLPVGSGSGTNPTGAVQEILVTGAGFGGAPHVRVFNTDVAHSVRFELLAYDINFRGGVRVATGDVNGDGVEDVITGAGPSGGPHVKVFDGRTGALMAS